MSSEIELGIDNLEREENQRESKKELERIKRLSDENLDIIKQGKENECDGRNIVVNLIATLDYYIREIVL